MQVRTFAEASLYKPLNSAWLDRSVMSAVLLSVGILVTCPVAVVAAQARGPLPPATSLRPTSVVGDTHPLKDVRGVAQANDTLVVLTSGSPAVHVFAPTSVRTWGRIGQGPGELENATAIARRSRVVHVLETSPGQSMIERFDLSGAHGGALRLRGYGIVGRFAPIAGGFVIQSSAFGQVTRSLLAISDSGTLRDSLATWTMPARVRLAPAEGPRYATDRPFAPVVEWAVLADSAVALWNPGDNRVTIIRDADHRTTRALPVLDPVRVSNADREFWLTTSFPEGFMNMSDDPLRYVRREAREVLKFPDVFPAVLALRAGAGAAVWVQRSPASQGEEWLVLDESGGCRRLRLPVGRELLSVGAAFLVAKAVDALGVELVERYRTTDVESHSVRCSPAGK
jgi:hypothetical protein